MMLLTTLSTPTRRELHPSLHDALTSARASFGAISTRVLATLPDGAREARDLAEDGILERDDVVEVRRGFDLVAVITPDGPICRFVIVTPTERIPVRAFSQADAPRDAPADLVEADGSRRWAQTAEGDLTFDGVVQPDARLFTEHEIRALLGED